jgi:hypothetical protein
MKNLKLLENKKSKPLEKSFLAIFNKILKKTIYTRNIIIKESFKGIKKKRKRPL